MVEMLAKKQVVSMIKRVATNSRKLNELIHDTAVQCMLHAQQHGDCTLMDNLVKSLHRGARVKALRIWVEDFSPIRWNGDDKVGILNEKAKTYTPYQIEEAQAKPFYDYTTENQKQPLTLEQLIKLVDGIPARIDKAENDGRFEGDVEAAKKWAAGLSSFAHVGSKALTTEQQEGEQQEGEQQRPPMH